jgi:hypothetical protein
MRLISTQHPKSISVASLLLAILAISFNASADDAPVIGITSFNNNFTAQVNLLGSTPSPGSVHNPGSPATGWDFTIASPGGTVTMAAVDDGANPGGTSDFAIRGSRGTAGFFVTSFSVKSDDGSAFMLQYAYFKINLFSGSSADITITGYKGGTAVPGATKTITGILTNPVWTQFDVSAISAFSNVDEFVFTQAASSSAEISFVAVDQIDIASPVDLPLTLTDFSGQRTGNNVLLGWTTATEQNTSYFEIQRGTDGADFAPLSKVFAAGNSDIIRNYQYTDPLPTASATVYFYRLKMADIDGEFTYSPVLAIGGNTHSGLSLTAYPNPFRQQLTLLMESPEAQNVQLLVTDFSGARLMTNLIPLQKGTNVLPLSSLQRLATGIYMVTLSMPQGQQVIRIVKTE